MPEFEYHFDTPIIFLVTLCARGAALCGSATGGLRLERENVPSRGLFEPHPLIYRKGASSAGCLSGQDGAVRPIGALHAGRQTERRDGFPANDLVYRRAGTGACSYRVLRSMTKR